MFNSAPYPPKDYVLKEVPKIQRSSPQFTPGSEPRVTQTTLGQYCFPVEYGEGEAPEKIEPPSVHPYIMEQWAKQAKAFWVDKPGKDAFLTYDMCRKYTVKFDSYNPTYMHKKKVFNRSYQYELVCLKDQRYQKLKNKCEREQSIWENEFNRVEKKEHEEKHPPMKVLECKTNPPFWWKQISEDTNQNGGPNKEGTLDDIPPDEKHVLKVGKCSLARWVEEPNLTAVLADDPCRRKYEMQLVGQPFKSEACNYYYKHYPPPNVDSRRKKLG